jgi:hypothetical protein
MKHFVFADDALFAKPESVLEPGRLEVQRPIRVVPFADLPLDPQPDGTSNRELLRRLERITRAA